MQLLNAAEVWWARHGTTAKYDKNQRFGEIDVHKLLVYVTFSKDRDYSKNDRGFKQLGSAVRGKSQRR